MAELNDVIKRLTTAVKKNAEHFTIISTQIQNTAGSSSTQSGILGQIKNYNQFQKDLLQLRLTGQVAGLMAVGDKHTFTKIVEPTLDELNEFDKTAEYEVYLQKHVSKHTTKYLAVYKPLDHEVAESHMGTCKTVSQGAPTTTKQTTKEACPPYYASYTMTSWTPNTPASKVYGNETKTTNFDSVAEAKAGVPASGQFVRTEEVHLTEDVIATYDLDFANNQWINRADSSDVLPFTQVLSNDNSLVVEKKA